jgi:hypothetical protein
MLNKSDIVQKFIILKELENLMETSNAVTIFLP